MEHTKKTLADGVAKRDPNNETLLTSPANLAAETVGTNSAQKNIADVTNADDDQIIRDNNITTAETFQAATVAPVAMHDHQPAQILKKLPQELLTQPRFFQLTGNQKGDTPKDWSNPDNQKLYTNINGLAGFDTCGHGRAADYLFLDFDHVLDDNGNFVNEKAEQCFNAISAIVPTFTEKSISEHGLHKLYKPTPNKFSPISAGSKGTLYFDDKRTKDSPKLEIFYGSKGRYCLFTGNLFHCEPSAPIASGDSADHVFQFLIDQIKQQSPPEPVKKSIPTTSAQIHTDSPDYDSFRAGIMLDCIVPADLPDTDWLAVQSAAKNIGIPYNVVDAFNQRDSERYNEEENLKRWDSLDNPSFDISTLHGIAKRFGYSEKDTLRQWYQLHPNSKPSNSRAKAIAPALKRELDDAIIFLSTLSPDDFTADDAYNQDNIRAVAIAQHFGFTSHVETFFNVISQAKSAARQCLKDADSGLICPLKDREKNSLYATSNINFKSIRDAIKRHNKEISASQNSFVQNQMQQQEIEKAQIRAKQHQQRVEADTARLISLHEQYQKHPTEELAFQIRRLIANICEWSRDRLGNKVAVKPTAKNLDLIFTYDPLIDGLIGYDEFRQADVFLKVPTWRKGKGNCIHEKVTDQDASQIRNYLCRTYSELANKNRIDDWLVEFSNKLSFHEVKDYFRNRNFSSNSSAQMILLTSTKLL